MNVKVLTQKIKTLENRLKRLESRKSNIPAIQKRLDQYSNEEEIRSISRARAILKRTCGIITKKKAKEWLKSIDKSRTSWT